MTALTCENVYAGRIVLAYLLLEMDPRVTHFEMVAAPRLAGRGDDPGDVASLVAP